MSRNSICGALPTLSSLLALLLLISLLTFIASISVLLLAHSSGNLSNQSLISLACHASSSPQACESSLRLSPLALNADSPARLVAIAVALAHRHAQLCHTLSQALLPVRSDDPNLASAAHNCEYLLRRTSHVLKKCKALCDEGVQMIESANAAGFRRMKDLEAWMSAALTWANDCVSALGYVNGTNSYDHRTSYQDLSHITPGLSHVIGSLSEKNGFTNAFNQDGPHRFELPSYLRMHIPSESNGHENQAADLVNYLMQHVLVSVASTSNALSMLGAYDTHGLNVNAWTPPSKQLLPGHSDFQHQGQRKRHTCNVRGLHPTVIVSPDGGHGTYLSIQEAVDAAPEDLSERYVIYIRQGVYNETVRISYTKRFLAFIGDGMGVTIITGNLNAQMPGISTYDTATIAVDGDDFLAYNMTFENTADPALHQAVALRVGGDRAVFYRCSFLGHQDTLYAHSLRQFYHSCRIEGTMDFIFGNAASIFQDCEVLIRPGRISSSVVAAQGRMDLAQTTGFVFENCVINGTNEFMESFVLNPKKYKVYLGRPWKMYSRTVYKNCRIERIVRPEGWRAWRGEFALKTLFYGEYNNTGIGADSTGRVDWAEQIPSSLAGLYTVPNFIQGDGWLWYTIDR